MHQTHEMPIIPAAAKAIFLPALVRVLLNSLSTISMFAALGFLFAVIYLHIAPYYYSATLTVVATQEQNQSLGSQVGELASLAGINTPSSQGISPFSLYPDAVISRIVADDIARTHPEILHQIFYRQWDERTNSWRKSSGLLVVVYTFVRTIFGIPIVPLSPPGGAELRDVIEREVNIGLDNKKPILTMTYRNPDPSVAKHFLDQINESTDYVLRRMTLDRSSKYARYLENKLSNVQGEDIRQVLINSYSQQETLVMMSSSNAPFAAQPLGVTVVSLTPISPQPVLVLVLGLLCGLAIGIADAVMEWHILGFLGSRRRFISSIK